MLEKIKGHFNSKIAYVSDSGNIRDRKKRIATINFDGTGYTISYKWKKFSFKRQNLLNDPNKLMILLYHNNTPSLFTINTETKYNSKVK